MKLSSPDIVELIENYEKQVETLRADALRMCWYMRGGLNYDQAMMLSEKERDIISKLIKENLETAKKSGLPFF